MSQTAAATGNTKITAAVIGLGMGRGHLNNLLANPNVKVVAACDKAPERIARIQQEHPELKADFFYDDYQKMIDRARPEAVIIALPNFLHHPVTMATLKAGVHVLCEKPMAMNCTEAAEMASTASRLGKALMINFSYRFKATTMAMEKVIAAGQVGQIYFASTGWLRQNGIPSRGWFYRKQMAGGGPLIDLGVHRIDLAWYLMGRPKVESVSGMTFQKFGPKVAADYDVEDLAAGFVKFKDGRCMQITVSWASFCETPEQMWTELYGTDGAAIERNSGGRLPVDGQDPQGRRRLPDRRRTERPSRQGPELDRPLRRLRDQWHHAWSQRGGRAGGPADPRRALPVRGDGQGGPVRRCGRGYYTGVRRFTAETLALKSTPAETAGVAPRAVFYPDRYQACSSRPGTSSVNTRCAIRANRPLASGQSRAP